jgi:hypothetical protein
MPQYDVTIVRTLELSTLVTVRAKTEEEAEEKALAQVSDSTLTWHISDTHDWQEDSDDCHADSVEQA